MDVANKLFIEHDLETWANVLEVVGFGFSIAAFIIGLLIKSQIARFRSEHLFDKRVNAHIKNLATATTEINMLLDNYDDNRELIKVQFSRCISELDDILTKIPQEDQHKCQSIRSFLRKRNKKPFVKRSPELSPFIIFITSLLRIFETSYDDVWTAYRGLNEVLVQLENIKLNRKQSI